MATSLQAKILNKIAQVFEDKGFQDIRVNQDKKEVSYAHVNGLGYAKLYGTKIAVFEGDFYESYDVQETFLSVSALRSSLGL